MLAAGLDFFYRYSFFAHFPVRCSQHFEIMIKNHHTDGIQNGQVAL